MEKSVRVRERAIRLWDLAQAAEGELADMGWLVALDVLLEQLRGVFAVLLLKIGAEAVGVFCKLQPFGGFQAGGGGDGFVGWA